MTTHLLGLKLLINVAKIVIRALIFNKAHTKSTLQLLRFREIINISPAS